MGRVLGEEWVDYPRVGIFVFETDFIFFTSEEKREWMKGADGVVV